MQVLLFGASNIDGRGLPDPQNGFVPLLNQSPHVDVTHVPFYITGPDDTGYFSKKLCEHATEVVIIKPTAGFAVQSMVRAAGRRFGERGTRIVQRIRKIVRNPRILGRVPLLGAFSTAVGRVMLGRAPALSGQEAVSRFGEVFDILDEKRLRAVIVLSGGPASPELARVQPSTVETILAFNDAMEREAGRRGYMWIDVFEVISAGGTREPQFMEDDPLHFAEDEHKLLAEAVLEALAAVDLGKTDGMEAP